ncbi:MAG: fumarate hydratase [Clostridia bacterium]|nr:fumarate hydratase [Clostridia bacterium]
MKIIHSDIITQTVKNMCIEANCNLPQDMKTALNIGFKNETSPIGREILNKIEDNYKIAEKKQVAICQDTGMAVFFVDIGNEVYIEGETITDAINEGVRQGYDEGFLRKSIVEDPLFRKNTNDNTPAIIHYTISKGDKVSITIIPKGFGSENMSAIKMFPPSAGIEGIKEFVINTVDKAGSNPCPPIVVGIGIGGDFESCACLAKKALARSATSKHPNEFYAALEDELLTLINKTGIGPQGFGGKTTAISVNIETAPTHIAGMPCAINISCHASRHLTRIIN